MPRYGLQCECKELIPVGIAQSGGTVVCPACGKKLDVPASKVLRSLPVVPDDENPSGSSRSLDNAPPNTWSRGLAALLLLTAALCFGVGSYLGYLRWTAPIYFGHSEEEVYDDIRKAAMNEVPSRVWDNWQYLVETGLPNHEPLAYFQLNERYEAQKPWLIGSWIVGGLSFLTFLGLTFSQGRNSPK